MEKEYNLFMGEIIDINYIIELIERQKPERLDVIEALRNASNGKWASAGYYQFVDSKNANQPGADWQIDESFALAQENDANIVLDLLKDGRIGGVEFLGLIDR